MAVLNGCALINARYFDVDGAAKTSLKLKSAKALKLKVHVPTLFTTEHTSTYNLLRTLCSVGSHWKFCTKDEFKNFKGTKAAVVNDAERDSGYKDLKSVFAADEFMTRLTKIEHSSTNN